MPSNIHNKPLFWAEHLSHLNKSILAQIERIRRGSKHSTITGSSIETILRRVLREYFPSRFSIGTGQVASSSGDISPQIDILIYDRTTFPILSVNEDGSVVVCCESVFGGIEVKTKWGYDKIESHFGGFAKIDSQRHPNFNTNSAEDAASYSIICIEPLKKLNLKWSSLRDETRKVIIASLTGQSIWISDWGETEFKQFPVENPLETLLQEILRDCMGKKFMEHTSPAQVYEAVRAYFGWKRLLG